MKTNEDEKNLIIDMMAWLPKMLSGKTLEAVYSDGSTETVTDVSCLIKDIKAGLTFRIKAIAFPDAPDGEQWHNPSNYSPEFLEVDNGWRLLLTSEVWGNHLKTRCQGVQTSGEWGEGFYGVAKRLTYRVKTSEHPVGSLKPKGEKLGGVYAKPIDRPGDRGIEVSAAPIKYLWNHRKEDFIRDYGNPLKGLKVRRAQ